MREVNRVLKKVKDKESKVSITKIGDKDELSVTWVSNASYHYDDKSVARKIVMLENKKTMETLPIYWK